MKYYKPLKFLLNFNVKHPRHKRKAPPPHDRKASLVKTFWSRFWSNIEVKPKHRQKSSRLPWKTMGCTCKHVAFQLVQEKIFKK